MSTESNVSPLDAAVEFAMNPEPRCPCVLLLDTSGSMDGAPIQALNDGLTAFKEALATDKLASKRVEVAVVTFDSEVKVVSDFVTADKFEPVRLTAQGITNMGAGIIKALDMIRDRKKQYATNGVQHYRPWVFMLTDGSPSDVDVTMQTAQPRIADDEKSKRVAFFAVGVESADMAQLKLISTREPVALKGLQFREMFVWLSRSMTSISHSKLNDQQVALTPPGWAAV